MDLTKPRFLIDTNILIDFLADALPGKESDMIEEIIEKSCNLSVITQIDFLDGTFIPRNQRSLLKK